MLIPLPDSTLLALREDFNFAFVFGEEDYGNTPSVGFTRADIAELYFVHYGERDEEAWRCVGRLQDGRYFLAEGGCDYTGWDCRASNHGETFPDDAALIRALGDDLRSKMGLGLDGLGSTQVRA